MSEISQICDACDSTNTELRNTKVWQRLAGDVMSEVTRIIKVCHDCGAEIDSTPDGALVKSLQKARTDSFSKALDCLHAEGFSDAGLERALELPQRTIARWKKDGKISASGYVLMRIIKHFPWIVDVAENRFDTGYAANRLFAAAGELLQKGLSEHNLTFSQPRIFVQENNVLDIRVKIVGSVSGSTNESPLLQNEMVPTTECVTK